MAKNSLEECKDQLLRLARSQVPTSKLAARAGLIALGFWAELRGRKRSELRHWLDVQLADAQQLIATSRLNAGVRKAEVMMGGNGRHQKDRPTGAGLSSEAVSRSLSVKPPGVARSMTRPAASPVKVAPSGPEV